MTHEDQPGAAVGGWLRSQADGRVVIPPEVARAAGITPGMPVWIAVADGEIHVRPARASETERGSPWLKELYDCFAPVRTEARQYTDEEINAAIDEAVKAVRSRHD